VFRETTRPRREAPDTAAVLRRQRASERAKERGYTIELRESEFAPLIPGAEVAQIRSRRAPNSAQGSDEGARLGLLLARLSSPRARHSNYCRTRSLHDPTASERALTPFEQNFSRSCALGRELRVIESHGGRSAAALDQFCASLRAQDAKRPPPPRREQ
jgi:hypothetical protein